MTSTSLRKPWAVVAGLVLAWSANAQIAPDQATGEVKKIDKAAQKITLKHGEIKSLDMPAMSMVFKVADPKLLESVKVGDTVRFSAELRHGAVVLTSLQTAP